MLSPCSDPGSEIECVFFSLKKKPSIGGQSPISGLWDIVHRSELSEDERETKKGRGICVCGYWQWLQFVLSS